jgi:hypothetical protein
LALVMADIMAHTYLLALIVAPGSCPASDLPAAYPGA